MSGFDGPIYLALGISAQLSRALLAAHALAGVLVLAVFPDLPMAPLWLAAIAADAVRVQWRLKRRRGDDIAALLVHSDDSWEVTLMDGTVVPAELLSAPWQGATIMALSLRLEGGRRRHLALLEDNCAGDARRRLRVRLRFLRGQD